MINVALTDNVISVEVVPFETDIVWNAFGIGTFETGSVWDRF